MLNHRQAWKKLKTKTFEVNNDQSVFPESPMKNHKLLEEKHNRKSQDKLGTIGDWHEHDQKLQRAD